MQLFITTPTIHNKQLTITEDRIIYQCTKVLRIKPWYQLTVQHQSKRYLCTITWWSADALHCDIITTIEQQKSDRNHGSWLLIALPNHHDKCQLIVQKCSEIGLDDIIFWKAQRSQLKTISPTNRQKYEMIALEATEQSRNRSLPRFHYIEDDLNNHTEILSAYTKIQWYCFEYHDQYNTQHILSQHWSTHTSNDYLLWCVWPEWWRTSHDIDTMKLFVNNRLLFVDLGWSILRTETACIIAWRMIKNINLASP
jgi:RsmE family RNA methyltransferase